MTHWARSIWPAGAAGRATLRDRLVLPCYLLFGALYLFYWPHAEWVLDDWDTIQRFEQAHVQGPEAEWQLARALARNQVWGTSRTDWFSYVFLFGLYHIAGPHPGFYLFLGILLHVAVGYCLRRALVRLEFSESLGFLAGALFLLLPTVHNPLFWFLSCGQYLFAAFWFLIYLHSVAGTVVTGRLELPAALLQVLVLTLALFSTDQVTALLLFTAPWIAVCWRSWTALAASVLAWSTILVAGGLYFGLVDKAPLAASVAATFDFRVTRVLRNLCALGADYGKLVGFGNGYYQVSLIGWGGAAALGAGLAAFWWLRTASNEGRSRSLRASLFGAGLWVLAYGPVWFLRWRELRYDYLPSLGLSVVVAVVCVALVPRCRRRLVMVGGSLLVAYGAATAIADIQQCWRPQSRNIQAIKQQLRRLKGVSYHDIVVISNAPMQIGTAPHFAMTLSHISRPFVETVTGVWGLVVGREIFCESGRLALQHTDFMHELKWDDVGRTHLLVCDTVSNCGPRSLLACETGPGRYEVYILKGSFGSPRTAGRAFSREDLGPLKKDIYFARHHLP